MFYLDLLVVSLGIPTSWAKQATPGLGDFQSPLLDLRGCQALTDCIRQIFGGAVPWWLREKKTKTKPKPWNKNGFHTFLTPKQCLTVYIYIILYISFYWYDPVCKSPRFLSVLWWLQEGDLPHLWSRKKQSWGKRTYGYPKVVFNHMVSLFLAPGLERTRNFNLRRLHAWSDLHVMCLFYSFLSWWFPCFSSLRLWDWSLT